MAVNGPIPYHREPPPSIVQVASGVQSQPIEAIEKPKAKERQAAGGGGTGCGKLPQPEPRTRDKVGKALGVSGKTYEKAKQVVAAAEAEPEMFGDLPAKMNAESVDARSP